MNIKKSIFVFAAMAIFSCATSVMANVVSGGGGGAAGPVGSTSCTSASVVFNPVVTGYSMDGGPAPTITWSNELLGWWNATIGDDNVNGSFSMDATDGKNFTNTFEINNESVVVNVAANQLSMKMETTTNENYMNGYVYFERQFTVSGSGLLVFQAAGSANFHVENAEWGSAYGNLNVHNYGWDVGRNSYSGSNVEATPSITDNFDNLIASLYFEDGEIGILSLSSSSSFNPAGVKDAAPVPVPGAIWLLGSGIVGLIGVRRKNK